MIPDLKTDFAFQIRVDFRERVLFGETPRGGRGYVPPTGGWIDGPRSRARSWAIAAPTGPGCGPTVCWS